MRHKWSPVKIIVWSSLICVALSAASSLWGASVYALHLNESQILYLFSTSAQVLAGIYGLTLTGFIFFRNELSREEFEDETLSDAVEGLKRRYSSLLSFITILVLLTFAASNLAISMTSSEMSLVQSLVINCGQSLYATSALVIAYFVFDVISPGAIKSASQNLQDKVDPQRGDSGIGSLEDFLRNYNEIENILLSTKYENSITSKVSPSFHSAPVRRTSNARLAEMLFRNEKIGFDLYEMLRKLITLRNSIVHGAEPVVSKEVVGMSEIVLRRLKEDIV
jgi:hypothetical protein